MKNRLGSPGVTDANFIFNAAQPICTLGKLLLILSLHPPSSLPSQG